MLTCRMPPHRKPRKPKKPTSFGQLLITAMAKKGLSQRQFAALIGEHQSIVSRVIIGSRRPNPEWLGHWAHVLEIPQDQREAFVHAGKTARLLGKADSSDHAKDMIDALRASITIASQLVTVLEDEGLQVPKEISEGLGILRSRWQ